MAPQGEETVYGAFRGLGKLCLFNEGLVEVNEVEKVRFGIRHKAR
jgi:hypothetical protein